MGNRAYVSGTGNFFTIFSEVKAVNITNSNQIVTWTGLRIISGEINSTGFRNWQHYLNMESKDGDSDGELIRTGASRIVMDGDGFSERYSNSFKITSLGDTTKVMTCSVCVK